MYQNAKANSSTTPIIRQDQFIVSGDTGLTVGMQSTTLKKAIHATAIMLISILYFPRLKGPFGMSRAHINRQTQGNPYATLAQITEVLMRADQYTLLARI